MLWACGLCVERIDCLPQPASRTPAAITSAKRGTLPPLETAGTTGSNWYASHCKEQAAPGDAQDTTSPQLPP